MDIYLSPHHDDVCFSLGHRAALTGGELVNLFTRSRYVEAGIALPKGEEERITAVTALRQREDEAFAKVARLRRHDLGLSEPPVLGISPFDHQYLRTHVEELSSRLIPLIMSLIEGQGTKSRARLYCPMGIGGHRDHVGTLVSVRRNLDQLAEHCDVLLYEDLPYASSAGARDQGLSQARSVYRGFEISPVMCALAPHAAAQKLALVQLYSSQLAQPPDPGQFTPASGLSQPHEIVWELSR